MQSIDQNTVITLFNEANGTNPNSDTRRAATEKLIQIQNSSGYPSTLLKIWQSSQPDELREIALTQFKNHATTNFKHSNNVQEKEHCKNLLLTTYLNEKSEQITKQIAQCIAKLTRKEWPSNWGQLFDVLVTNIQKDDAHSVLWTAMVISDILQESMTMRLPRHHAALHQLSEKLMPILFSIWNKAFQFSFNLLESKQKCDLKALHQCLKLCLLLSRSMKVLIQKSNSVDFTNHSVGGQYLAKCLEIIQKLHDRYYIQLASHKDRNQSPLKDVIRSMGGILKALLLTVRKTHNLFTLQFRLLLPSFLSYYCHLIIKHRKNRQRQINEPYLNEVMVYALLFLTDVARSRTYDGKKQSSIRLKLKGVSQGKVEFNENEAAECKMIVENFFNQDRLTMIVQCLVQDLFLLSRKDLEERRVDPCTKWQEMHIEHNDDNIRAAAKHLLRALLVKYRDICGPIVIRMFKGVDEVSSSSMPSSPRSPRSPQSMKSGVGLLVPTNHKELDPLNEGYRPYFLKEAVYLGFGLKYWELAPYLGPEGCSHDEIGRRLSTDLRAFGRESGYLVPWLCARIIWLFGKMKEDINHNKETKQFVYNAVLAHLEPLPPSMAEKDSDLENEVLVMRLNAAQALYRLLDDNVFEPTDFEHLLERTFVLMLKLVADCDSSLETMTDILQYICTIIRQNVSTLSGENRHQTDGGGIGDDHGPNDQNPNAQRVQIEHSKIVASVFNEMGKVWDQCDSTETNLCRVNLIECIRHLVGCMASPTVHTLYPRLIPMIAYCTECCDDDSRLCLIEQGLELWHTVLYHSYRLEQSTDALFTRNWIPQMKENCDYFEILMGILKSYLLLGGGQFVQSHAQEIGNVLTLIVPDVTQLEDQFSKLTDVLCVFVQLFPKQSPTFLQSVIEHLVHDFMASPLLQSGGGGDLNGGAPGFCTSPTVRSDSNRIECYMLFFCRLLLVNADGMLKVLKSIQQKVNGNNLMKTLFQGMFTMKERVRQFYKQKIVVLGLIKIFQGVVANDGNAVVPLLSELLPWWLKVIEETEIDTLEFADDMHPEMDGTDKSEWTEADRISNLYCNDIVSHTFMIDVVLKVLKEVTVKMNGSMESLLQQIQGQSGCQDLMDRFKQCSRKYDEYLRNKNESG